MKKVEIIFGIIVVVLAFFAQVKLQMQHTTVSDISSVVQNNEVTASKPISAATSIPLIVSEEEKRNIEKDFFGLLTELEHYPIKELREPYNRFAIEGKSGRIQLNMDPVRDNVLASFSRCDGHSIFSISAKNWIKGRKTLDAEAFKDRFLLTILHEFYHYEHEGSDSHVVETRAVFLDYELKAWSYELGLMNIMIQKGREKSILAESFNRFVWDNYKKCNKDSKSFCWVNFITDLHKGVEPVPCSK